MPTPFTPTLSSATASWVGSWRYGGPKVTLALTINDNTIADTPPYPIVDGTEIERSPNGGGFSVIYTCGGPLGGANIPTTWDDASTEDGTAYTYRIRVRDVDMNYSAYSDEKGAQTILPRPGPPEAVGDVVTVRVKWGRS
jgi:hypothetical protein